MSARPICTLSYDDLARLRHLFRSGRHGLLEPSDQDERISQWLDAMIADAEARAAGADLDGAAQRETVEKSRWRHGKSGGFYTEIGRAVVQASTGTINEDNVVVIYQGDNGRLWARERHEFEDGRFEPVHEPASSAPPAWQERPE